MKLRQPNPRPVKMPHDTTTEIMRSLLQQVGEQAPYYTSEQLDGRILAAEQGIVSDVRGRGRRYEVHIKALLRPGEPVVLGGTAGKGKDAVNRDWMLINIYVNSHNKPGDGAMLARVLQSKPFAQKLYMTFLHELTHVKTLGYVAKKKYALTGGDDSRGHTTMAKEGSVEEKDARVYINDPNETPSQIQEVAHEAEVRARKSMREHEGKMWQFKRRKDLLDDIFDTRNPWTTYAMLDPFLTEKNRRRIMLAVVRHLDEAGLLSSMSKEAFEATEPRYVIDRKDNPTMRKQNPSASLLKGVELWHGTGTLEAGLSILRDGKLRRIVPEGKYGKKGRSHEVSLEGRVYVTTDPNFAAMYALGCDCVGQNMGPGPISKSRYGWVMRVEAGPNSDIIVDEDQVGRLAVEADIPWFNELAKLHGGAVGTPGKPGRPLIADAKIGVRSSQIRLGKLLLRKMSNEQLAALIPHATQFAIEGDVRLVEAWKIDKTKSGKMTHGDWDSVTALSERVPVDSQMRKANTTMRWRKVSEPGEYDVWTDQTGNCVIAAPFGAKGPHELSFRGVEVGQVKTLAQAEDASNWRDVQANLEAVGHHFGSKPTTSCPAKSREGNPVRVEKMQNGGTRVLYGKTRSIESLPKNTEQAHKYEARRDPASKTGEWILWATFTWRAPNLGNYLAIEEHPIERGPEAYIRNQVRVMEEAQETDHEQKLQRGKGRKGNPAWTTGSPDMDRTVHVAQALEGGRGVFGYTQAGEGVAAAYTGSKYRSADAAVRGPKRDQRIRGYVLTFQRKSIQVADPYVTASVFRSLIVDKTLKFMGAEEAVKEAKKPQRKPRKGRSRKMNPTATMPVEVAKAVIARAEQLGVKGKPNKATAERILRAWLTARGLETDRYGNFLKPDGDRFHFSENNIHRQYKGSSGWSNITSVSMIDYAITILSIAGETLGQPKWAALHEKRKGERAKAATKAEEKRLRDQASELAAKALAFEEPTHMAKSMRRETLPDDVYQRLIVRKTQLVDTYLELLKAGGPLPDDSAFATIDRPPVAPLYHKSEYSWVETVDGHKYTVTVRSAGSSGAEIHIGSTGGVGLMVDAFSMGVVAGPGGEGDAYVSGKIVWSEAKKRPYAALFLIQATEKQKGAGSRVLDMWCRMMKGYGVPKWMAQAIGPEGAAFLKARAAKGKIRILGTEGSNALVECM